MFLNETQKQEVADHVSGITRYIETYNEIYDHVLSALEQEEQKSFQIELVLYIIDRDFGGAAKIQVEEQNSRIALYSSFSGTLKREMLNTFKFPAVINNFALLSLGLIFYLGNANSQTIVSVTIAGTLIILLIPLLLFVYKSYILERQQAKPSVSDYALRYNALFGLNTATCVFYASFSWDVLTSLEPGILVAIMWVTYFFLSVFLRAYLKMYKSALRLKLH
jgi:hypothetical protein